MTIVLEHLGFAYDRLPVLVDLSARADAGRVVAVLGPNAAGKSTLLRCITGALRPQRGAALVDGRPAFRLRGRALARRIAYVPQRSTVAASFTVRQVVELGRYALPPDSTRVRDALRRCELDDIAGRPYPELSVGQQQRVTLARALAQLEVGGGPGGRPAGHLILDEPMSAMDLGHVRHTLSLLRELAAAGVSILIAMHDLTQAASLADDVWLLEAGRLHAAGPAGEVLTPEILEPVFSVGFEVLTDSRGEPVLVPRTGRARMHPS